MMNYDDMRNFIVLAESLDESSFAITAEESAQVEPVVEEVTPIILHDLEELATRMRGFMETESGDYALGMEMGMQRAAEMIENLVRRYKEGGPL